MADNLKKDVTIGTPAGQSSSEKAWWRERSCYIFAFGFLLAGGLWMLPVHHANTITNEGHIIESVTPMVLGMGVLVGLFHFARNPRCCWMAVSLMLLWAVLRELDFQKRFTGQSIESTRFYFSRTIPLQVKLITVVFLTPFLLAGFHLLKVAYRHREFVIRERPLWAKHLLMGFGCAVVAVSAEKAKLDRAGIIEEVGELTFACLVLLALLEFPRKQIGTKKESALKPEPPMEIVAGGHTTV